MKLKKKIARKARQGKAKNKTRVVIHYDIVSIEKRVWKKPLKAGGESTVSEK